MTPLSDTSVISFGYGPIMMRTGSHGGRSAPAVLHAFWGDDDAIKLAKGLRAAVNQTNSRKQK
jgi:hypothetical protein